MRFVAVGGAPDEKSAGAAQRVTFVIGVVALVVALAIGIVVVGGRAYFRVDLFGAYAAGYASVTAEATPDQGVACNAAVKAAFPSVSLVSVEPWPDPTAAYWLGCNDRRGGLAADPWILHDNLYDGD